MRPQGHHQQQPQVFPTLGQHQESPRGSGHKVHPQKGQIQPLQNNLEISSRPNFHQATNQFGQSGQGHLTTTQSNPPPKSNTIYPQRDSH